MVKGVLLKYSTLKKKGITNFRWGIGVKEYWSGAQ